MNNNVECGEKIQIKSEEEFNSFINYWQAVAKSETKKKKKQTRSIIVCGDEKFKCGMNNGECR